MMPLSIVILAAGKGTRMRSDLPKVLHTLAGRPMLQHVLDTALSLKPTRCVVVYGYGGDLVQAEVANNPQILAVEQSQQLGTGHALMQAAPHLPKEGVTLVLYGDVPCIPADILQTMIKNAAQNVVILTDVQSNPTGYGRILRAENGDVLAIVEEKDASEQERQIREINTGILAMPSQHVANWLARLSQNNQQNEYYLTDCVALARADGVAVSAVQIGESWQASGVNSPRQLATLERQFQRAQAEKLLDLGVTLLDPARFDLRGRLTCGRDVKIDVNVIIEGDVVLGDGVSIGAHCMIKNAKIARGTTILPFSHIDGAVIGEAAQIGPYARLRPETQLGDAVRVGNFVEIKKSFVGKSSKINHLSYIGDASIGDQVNIGAGTITCNYDGVNKFRTEIGSGAFVGSGTMLVAPLQVGVGAVIGAGSVVSKIVPAQMLTLSRVPARTVPSWRRPEKNATK